MDDYASFLEIISTQNCKTILEQRKHFATRAHISSHYDTAIFNYFNTEQTYYKSSIENGQVLRYGENPHQKGFFLVNLTKIFYKTSW